MAPKKTVTKISSLSVTAEEVAAARKLLGTLDEKAKASKMASMIYLCKNSGDSDVVDARGKGRQDYLEKFVAFQQWNEKAKLTTTISKETTQVSGKETEKEWMGMETMDAKLGPVRAKFLMEKNVFQRRACPFTKSNDDIHAEWNVPKDLERFIQKDLKMLKIDGVHDTEDGDYEALDSALAFEPTNTGTASGIKQEGKTETGKMAERLDAFIAPKDATLRRFQDFKVEAKSALSKASSSKDKNTKYASAVITDLEKHVPKFEKVAKLLERVCTEEVTDPTEFPKLLETTDQLEEKHKEIMDWAAKFSFCAVAPVAKRRKTVNTQA